MISTASPGKKERSSKAAKPRLDRETPLLPLLVAESICAEAAAWLDDDRPLAFAPALAARAVRVYTCAPLFARRLRARGNTGRAWLRAFLRHWLAARLRRQHRDLFDRLPSSFCMGVSLALPSVAKPPGSTGRLMNSPTISTASRPRKETSSAPAKPPRPIASYRNRVSRSLGVTKQSLGTSRKLMLTRGGDYVLIGGKFPRLAACGPAEQLRETLAVLRSF